MVSSIVNSVVPKATGQDSVTLERNFLRCRRRAFVSFCLIALSVLLLGLNGCAITPVSQYDAVTDQSLMALHRDLESYFISMQNRVGTPAADFDGYREFYQELNLDVSALRLRVDSIPDNGLTQRSMVLLEENVALLQEIHQEGIDSLELLDVLRADFATAFRNMLRFELAKKR